MRNVLLASGLALSVLVSTGCDFEEFDSSTRFTDEFHHTYRVKPGARIALDTFNGQVEITGWDEDSVEIRGSRYASTKELMEAIRIDIDARPESVTIHAVRPSERRGGMGAKFTLRVPRKVQLERIVNSNGSVRVDDIEGPARVRTSNGAVRVARLKGDFEAQTSNGSVEVESLEGSGVVRTSNGRVRASGVSGGFEAATSNGGISVALAGKQPGRPVRLETSNGPVDLRMESTPRNDVRISTSNGGITVHLPQDAAARVDLNTSNSSITTDFDVKSQGTVSKRRLQGNIGAGGPLIDLSTTNGGIRLLKM